MRDLNEDWRLEFLASEQAKFCNLFSNPRRIRILWALADSELSVGAIADKVGSSLQNVSQHLSKMKEYEIVISRRDKQTIYYRIDTVKLEQSCSSLLQPENLGINLTFGHKFGHCQKSK